MPTVTVAINKPDNFKETASIMKNSHLLPHSIS